MENKVTKQCKKCKEDINKAAKKCPHCGAKQGMPIWLIVILVIVGISVIASIGSNGTETENSGSGSEGTKTEEKIEYIKVSIDELEDALEENAASAKDTYNKKYVEVSGRLGTIDSDLKYISLLSPTDKWDIIGIHCTIKNSKQKDVIKTLKKDQDIVVKGKITDVGEVLGYYLDIDEVIAQ